MVGLDRESYVCFLSVLSVAVLPISALPVADLQTGMSVLSVAVLSMSVWVCLGLFGSVLPVADLQTGMFNIYVVCEVGGGEGRDGIVESVLVMLVS